MSSSTGRWTDKEHVAFEEGLRQFGTNWRKIQALVPTRTLVQIRTHAQKYFLKHGTPAPGTSQAKDSSLQDGEEGDLEEGEDSVGGSTSGLEIHPLATIRHIALEPVRQGQPLGFEVQYNPQTRHCHISSIVSSDGNSGSGEESALMKVGDVVLGVTGIATMGMDVLTVHRTIESARQAVPGGALVLHLSDTAIDVDVLQEAAIQMADAASQLLGSPNLVTAAQNTVQQTVFNTAIPVPTAR